VHHAAHLPFRHADSGHTYTGDTANAADVDLQARSFRPWITSPFILPGADQYFSAPLKSANPRCTDNQILSLFLSFIMLQ
jgi:hypothetical protein